VAELEGLADEFTNNKASKQYKRAIVKGIPRQAVLKPAHALYRLQNQHFAIGDRVTMIQDSGGVPLSVKGVVVGLNAKSMDVVWDVPFMSGGTLGSRY
jgi:5'-3' exoribonuclease 1